MSQAQFEIFEKLASGLYLEGLAVDSVRDIVWYSDVIAGGIHGVTPKGQAVTSFNTSRMWTGGILLNECGAILSSGQGGIMWNDPFTGASGWLIDKIDGIPINGVNEMMPDGSGGIYFGTVDIEMIEQGKPPRPAALYRLTVDGEVLPVASGLGFANGIMVSKDYKHLFYNDTFDATYVFKILPDRSLTGRRKLLDKFDCDGMALDENGNLLLTGFRSSSLARLKPDGTSLSPIETPAGAITQVRFGGADMRDMYFTSVPADGGDTLKEGGEITARESFLYRGRSAVAGMPIAPTQFKLS
ncbi:SMP-30/gluconolactonase/LRE family protein [Acidocella sp.]|uniref:SMP-30/gluconolactonase/LRE family protein n=1 Tax=Acidocella sp. TaxID=50710 RepID=UPI00260849B9|nr:SMP-30/gluconolactonase/LRE family protein [Acidocella sp.]